MGGRAFAAMALAGLTPGGMALGGGAQAQSDDPPAIDAATLDGVASFARITAQAPGHGPDSREGGPWEAFRKDSKGYRTYACGRYR